MILSRDQHGVLSPLATLLAIGALVGAVLLSRGIISIYGIVIYMLGPAVRSGDGVAGLLSNFVFMNGGIFRQRREVLFIVLNLIVFMHIRIVIMSVIIRPSSIVIIIVPII